MLIHIYILEQVSQEEQNKSILRLNVAAKPGELYNHIWDQYSLINYIYLRYDQHVFGSEVVLQQS